METVLTKNKIIYSANHWILFQFFILIFSLLLNSVFLNNLFLCFMFYCFSSLTSLRLFRFLPRIGNDFMDPGFLVIFFNILTIIPMTTSMFIGLEVLNVDWAISQIEIFTKVIYLHIVFISSFVISYYLLNYKTKPKSNYNLSFLTSDVWIYLFIVITLLVLVINILTGNFYTRADGHSGDMVRLLHQDHSLFSRQIFSRLNGLEGYIRNIAFGVILCRAKTIKRARVYMFLLPTLLFIYSFVLQGSRGAATTLIPIIAFADIVKWEGKLLNWPLFLIVFLGGFLFMHFVEIIENVVFFSGGIGNWQVALFTALEPRLVENVGAVVTMVDDLNVPLRYGSSYLDAFKSLIPNQLISKPVVTLSEWFIFKLYGQSYIDIGSAYVFSAIAEGYLNFKLLGVIFSGFLMALVASLIRFFKCSARIKNVGPLFFTCSILISYKLLRGDFVGIVKRLEWTFILVSILIFLVTIIIAASKKSLNEKSVN